MFTRPRQDSIFPRSLLAAAIAALSMLLLLSPVAAEDGPPPASAEEAPVAAEEVAEDAAEAKDAGTCFVIQVHGVIGVDFRAVHMEEILEEAAEIEPDVVLLDVDTPGGLIGDAEEIVDLIINQDELRFAAYVHKALSAGAAITLACEDICMDRAATIGGATSFHMTEDGAIAELPKDIEEKFRSVWRATCRKAAENGGHSTLLAEAMTDRDFALTMRDGPDGPILERNGEGTVVAAKGRLLTMTAREAVTCGLATAEVKDLEGVAEALGYGSLRRLNTAIDYDEDEHDKSLCGLLRTKLDERPDEREMTYLQRDAWIKEMEAWIRDQLADREGQRVHWVLRMLEAEPPCTREQMREARRRVDMAGKNYRRARGEEKRLWGERLRESREYLKSLHSFDVVARPLHDDRMMIVCQFPNDMVDEFADRKRDSMLYVTGILEDIRLPEREGEIRTVFHWHTARPFDAGIRLVRCEAGEKVKAYMERRRELEREKAESEPKVRSRPDPAPAETPAYDAAELAQKKLSMAKLYVANKMHAKAREILQALIEEYPDTDAADQARKLLTELADG